MVPFNLFRSLSGAVHDFYETVEEAIKPDVTGPDFVEILVKAAEQLENKAEELEKAAKKRTIKVTAQPTLTDTAAKGVLGHSRSSSSSSSASDISSVESLSDTKVAELLQKNKELEQQLLELKAQLQAQQSGALKPPPAPPKLPGAGFGRITRQMTMDEKTLLSNFSGFINSDKEISGRIKTAFGVDKPVMPKFDAAMKRAFQNELRMWLVKEMKPREISEEAWNDMVEEALGNKSSVVLSAYGLPNLKAFIDNKAEEYYKSTGGAKLGAQAAIAGGVLSQRIVNSVVSFIKTDSDFLRLMQRADPNDKENLIRNRVRDWVIEQKKPEGISSRNWTDMVNKSFRDASSEELAAHQLPNINNFLSEQLETIIKKLPKGL